MMTDANFLNTDYYKINLNHKSKNLLEKIKRLKSYGKKNSFKSQDGS